MRLDTFKPFLELQKQMLKVFLPVVMFKIKITDKLLLLQEVVVWLLLMLNVFLQRKGINASSSEHILQHQPNSQARPIG